MRRTIGEDGTINIISSALLLFLAFAGAAITTWKYHTMCEYRPCPSSRFVRSIVCYVTSEYKRCGKCHTRGHQRAGIAQASHSKCTNRLWGRSGLAISHVFKRRRLWLRNQTTAPTSVPRRHGLSSFLVTFARRSAWFLRLCLVFDSQQPRQQVCSAMRVSLYTKSLCGVTNVWSA